MLIKRYTVSTRNMCSAWFTSDRRSSQNSHDAALRLVIVWLREMTCCTYLRVPSPQTDWMLISQCCCCLFSKGSGASQSRCAPLTRPPPPPRCSTGSTTRRSSSSSPVTTRPTWVLCVCVCVCLRACVRVRVRVHICVCHTCRSSSVLSILSLWIIIHCMQ